MAKRTTKPVSKAKSPKPKKAPAVKKASKPKAKKKAEKKRPKAKQEDCLVCGSKLCDYVLLRAEEAGGSHDISNMLPLCEVHLAEAQQAGVVHMISHYNLPIMKDSGWLVRTDV